jgi:DNA-binding PadR family transcriptional regulator
VRPRGAEAAHAPFLVPVTLDEEVREAGGGIQVVFALGYMVRKEPVDICPQRTYNTAMKTLDALTPLTPAVFHILLALAGGDKHGYEIMKQVRHDSQGKVTMGNGTLYGSIKRMLADGLVEDAGDNVDPSGDDERRRYYTLTERGRQALTAEMQRYHELVTLIQQRGLL